MNYTPGGVTTIAYNQARDRVQLVGPNGPVTYTYTPSQRMIGAGQTFLQWNLAGGCTQVTRPTATTAFFYRTDGALQTITRNSQAWQIVLGPLGEIARVTLPGGSSRWFAYDFSDRSGLSRRVIMLQPGTQVTDSSVFARGTEDRAAAPSPVGTSAAPLMWLKSPPSQVNQRAPLTDPWGSIALVADGVGNMLQARVYGVFGELLAETSNPQFVAQGFLGMDVEEGLADPFLLGLSADRLRFPDVVDLDNEDWSDPFTQHGGGEWEGVGEANKAQWQPAGTQMTTLIPYLAETGSFLCDTGFGPDGLYSGPGPQGGPGQFENPWSTVNYGASWDASGLVSARNRPARDNGLSFQIQNIEDEYAWSMRSLMDALKKLLELMRELMSRV